MNDEERMGRHFRGLLNDLKRRPEDAARELGIPIKEIISMLDGKTAITSEVVQKATAVWPLSARDFYLLNDDTPLGVKVMRAQDSMKSSRVMARAGKPYYEYRDTVMSGVATFRPEWIMELCVVDNNDPENPALQWNNGHFMHQFTYFVGPVNFYYKGKDGKKHITVMNTGDSMYITPFIPHTFATRKNDRGERGIILALTYGDKLSGDAQQELLAIGPELASGFFLDFSSAEKAFASLLRFYITSASISVEELSRSSGVSAREIDKYLSGEVLPEIQHISRLASALMISARDLLPPNIASEKVIIRNYADSRRWSFPTDTNAYEIVELAANPILPHSKAIELTVKENHNPHLDLIVGLHQYGYNVGVAPVTLSWELGGKTHTQIINCDDSFYIKPFLKHGFSGPGKLLLLRIGGRVAGEPQRELSSFDKTSLVRVLGETVQWYDASGRQDI